MDPNLADRGSEGQDQAGERRHEEQGNYGLKPDKLIDAQPKGTPEDQSENRPHPGGPRRLTWSA
jgi:hypothetical protein